MPSATTRPAPATKLQRSKGPLILALDFAHRGALVVFSVRVVKFEVILAICVNRRDEAHLSRSRGKSRANTEHVLIEIVAAGGIEVVEIELQPSVAGVGVATPVFGLNADGLGEVRLTEQRIDIVLEIIVWAPVSV